MAQDRRRSVQEAIWGFPWYPNTREDVKPVGGAKMGDPNWKTELEAIGKAMDAQNCVILGLRDEIEQLRKLVRQAYHEGVDDGWAAEAGRSDLSWETSNVRKALDNAP